VYLRRIRRGKKLTAKEPNYRKNNNPILSKNFEKKERN